MLYNLGAPHAVFVCGAFDQPWASLALLPIYLSFSIFHFRVFHLPCIQIPHSTHPTFAWLPGLTARLVPGSLFSICATLARSVVVKRPAAVAVGRRDLA